MIHDSGKPSFCNDTDQAPSRDVILELIRPLSRS